MMKKRAARKEEKQRIPTNKKEKMDGMKMGFFFVSAEKTRDRVKLLCIIDFCNS